MDWGSVWVTHSLPVSLREKVGEGFSSPGLTWVEGGARWCSSEEHRCPAEQLLHQPAPTSHAASLKVSLWKACLPRCDACELWVGKLDQLEEEVPQRSRLVLILCVDFHGLTTKTDCVNVSRILHWPETWPNYSKPFSFEAFVHDHSQQRQHLLFVVCENSKPRMCKTSAHASKWGEMALSFRQNQLLKRPCWEQSAPTWLMGGGVALNGTDNRPLLLHSVLQTTLLKMCFSVLVPKNKQTFTFTRFGTVSWSYIASIWKKMCNWLKQKVDS